MLGIYQGTFYPCLICGHDEEAHKTRRNYLGLTTCLRCNSEYIHGTLKPIILTTHNFKLDNLAYIEGLATQRNLI